MGSTYATGLILIVSTIYLAIGLVFALVFHFTGLRRVDSGVENAGWVFRLLITPGLVGLWPLMALKWRRALRSEATEGAVDEPVTPRGLRTLHRVLTGTVLLIVPAVAVAALLARPARAPEQVRAVQPEVELPQLVAVVEQPFAELPIADAVRVEVRTDGRRHQLVAQVSEDLELPDLALYLTPEEGPRQTHGEAQFLGTLWGPATHRYRLPADFDPEAGWLLKLYSLSHREFVAVHEL